MADTFNKKALEQKRAKKKKDKLERKEERKTNNDKGKSLEEMTVYLDEFGNFTNIPPEKQKRRKPDNTDLPFSEESNIENQTFTGVLSLFFTEKGYGFITEDGTKSTVFVHSNEMMEPITEKNFVTFGKKKGPKGYSATNVRKIK